ncbi:MAG: hypothetical protein WCW52_12085 [Elusimicrobiales bacterium]|jgi:hypothetical protein
MKKMIILPVVISLAAAVSAWSQPAVAVSTRTSAEQAVRPRAAVKQQAKHKRPDGQNARANNIPAKRPAGVQIKASAPAANPPRNNSGLYGKEVAESRAITDKQGNAGLPMNLRRQKSLDQADRARAESSKKKLKTGLK